MNKFIQHKLKEVRATSLFVTMILLLAVILNSTVLSSQGISYAYEKADLERAKPHEHKFTRLKPSEDPFRFPMPLGQLDTDRGDLADGSIQQHSQHSEDLSSSSDTTTKQSTFKVTISSDKKMTKKIRDNTTEVPFNINTKSAYASDISLIQQKSDSVVATDTNKTSRIYSLHFTDKDIPVRYEVTGFSNSVLNMTMQTDNATLLIYLSSLSPGKFTIELARNILDSTNKDMHSDSPFAVFEDGHYTSFHETENNSYIRKLTMQFNKGTSQIAIAGTHASPEYGGTTTAFYGISMCISIIVLIAVTRRRRFTCLSLGRL